MNPKFTFKYFWFFAVILSSLVAHTATQEEVLHIEDTLNEVFHSQISQTGHKKVLIYLDPRIPQYAGGVNIVNEEIRIIVGQSIALEYPLGALQFLVCHELGHLLGGAPYKTEKLGRRYKTQLISTEGQSDYWAGRECLPQLTETPISAAEAFFNFLSQSLQDIVKDNPFYAPPAYGVRDDHFYDAEYPSFQCRFNSAVAGVEGAPRPSCWYPPTP